MKAYKTCFALLASLLLTSASAFADNPIIPNQGVCDPHIRIFNNKAFLFSSHDFGKGERIYKMVDWQLFSSPDLITWKKEFVLRPEDTYIGPWHECYAPDGATRNGKYYFYFSQQQKQAGVAVSDKPEGPYVDALKKPLLPANLTPSAEYDMSVYTDDDEARTPYIVWGYTVANKDYYIARLNEDMISLAETPRKIVIHQGWKNDAPALHKRNGIYYLNAHGAQYATATNVYGPYTYRGQYTKEWSDHGSFFTWNNQTFHPYGVKEIPNDPFYRTTRITYAHYKDNGDIVTDDFIGKSPLGVGQYDPTWLRTEAEWYFAASDGLDKREIPGGFEIRGITDGSWLRFPKVQQMSEGMSLNIRVSSGSSDGGTIEVRQDDPDGPLLGSVTVPDTGGWEAYRTVTTTLKNKAGTQDLCFVFKGKGKELMRLDWWNTDQSVADTDPESRLEAASVPIELDVRQSNQAEIKALDGGGYDITTIGEDPYVMCQPIAGPYDPVQQYMLSFDYVCAERLEPVQLFYGPPICAEQSAVGPQVPSSDGWTNYSINIRACQIPGSWRGGYKQFRLDFGNAAGRTLQIRNIRLSQGGDQERIAAELAEKQMGTKAKEQRPNTTAKDTMSYLENDLIRVGADLSIGGSITHLSTKDGPNMINSHDWGRQIQMSFYSGPNPFEPNGKKPNANWKQLGWNPIQSGDCYRNSSTVLEHKNDGNTIYIKCRPMQWPLNNEPGECIFECLYRLEGNVVYVKSRLANARDDKTQYGGRHQELPALYSNGPWYRIMTYTGDKPYTGSSLIEVPRKPERPPFPWNGFQATEEWAALVDKNDQGFGVWTPGLQQYIGGFVGRTGQGGSKDSSTGYLAPLHTEILDCNIDYRFEYRLIVGSVETIRDYVSTHRAVQKGLNFKFNNDRQHWHYQNASDSGFPIQNELNIQLNKDNPMLISPWFCMDANSVKTITLRAAFKTSETTAQLIWTKHGSGDFVAGDSISIPVTSDGVMRDYKISLKGTEAWQGVITRLALKPCTQGGNDKWIKLQKIIAE